MPQSEDNRNFGLQNGVSPIGAKTVAIDFDATIVPWDDLFSYPQPLPGAAEAIRSLKAAGYRIVVLTSRLSSTWCKAEDESPLAHRQYIEALLKTWDIPFDEITGDKVPAIAYIDDRAVEFTGDWSAVVRRFLH